MPVGRGEECPECVAGIRACRMCRFYDADAHNACREPMADLVADKEKSNICDYFQPRTGSGREDDSEAAESKTRLEALFGKKIRRRRRSGRGSRRLQRQAGNGGGSLAPQAGRNVRQGGRVVSGRRRGICGKHAPATPTAADSPRCMLGRAGRSPADLLNPLSCGTRCCGRPARLRFMDPLGVQPKCNAPGSAIVSTDC